MKHIRKFLESGQISYDLHRKIFDEVKDIKYILEDEGYKVTCFPINKRKTMICIGHGVNIEKIRQLEDDNPEYYLEFMDRIDEFCWGNNLNLKIYVNQFAGGVEISLTRTSRSK